MSSGNGTYCNAGGYRRAPPSGHKGPNLSQSSLDPTSGKLSSSQKRRQRRNVKRSPRPRSDSYDSCNEEDKGNPFMGAITHQRKQSVRHSKVVYEPLSPASGAGTSSVEPPPGSTCITTTCQEDAVSRRIPVKTDGKPAGYDSDHETWEGLDKANFVRYQGQTWYVSPAKKTCDIDTSWMGEIKQSSSTLTKATGEADVDTYPESPLMPTLSPANEDSDEESSGSETIKDNPDVSADHVNEPTPGNEPATPMSTEDQSPSSLAFAGYSSTVTEAILYGNLPSSTTVTYATPPVTSISPAEYGEAQLAPILPITSYSYLPQHPSPPAYTSVATVASAIAPPPKQKMPPTMENNPKPGLLIPCRHCPWTEMVTFFHLQRTRGMLCRKCNRVNVWTLSADDLKMIQHLQ